MAERPRYVYRLKITFPDGSMDANGFPVPGWRPKADVLGNPIDPEEALRLESWSGAVKWPRVRDYLSEKGAHDRAWLFEKWGCLVEVVRSAPVDFSGGVVQRNPMTPDMESAAIAAVARIHLETS